MPLQPGATVALQAVRVLWLRHQQRQPLLLRLLEPHGQRATVSVLRQGRRRGRRLHRGRRRGQLSSAAGSFLRVQTTQALELAAHPQTLQVPAEALPSAHERHVSFLVQEPPARVLLVVDAVRVEVLQGRTGRHGEEEEAGEEEEVQIGSRGGGKFECVSIKIHSVSYYAVIFLTFVFISKEREKKQNSGPVSYLVFLL